MHRAEVWRPGEGREPQKGDGKIATDGSPSGQGRLTRRETEIIGLLAHGHTDGEIGAILGISPRTVSKHVENILAKLGIASRTAAAVAWVASFGKEQK